MTGPINQQPDFNALAKRAFLCGQQWRGWAQREPAASVQARRAFELAALFEEQASVLNAMHRSRIEWTKTSQRDFTGAKQ